MSLARQEVEKVSLLARLQLSPQELDTLTTQLGAHRRLCRATGRAEHRRRRADGPRARRWRTSFGRTKSLPACRAKQALANAPHHDAEFYLVPAVLGE